MNSIEISFVISMARPKIDLGISKKELVKELKDYSIDSKDPYKRIKELTEWSFKNYTNDWFKAVIASPDDKRQFGSKKYSNIFR